MKAFSFLWPQLLWLLCLVPLAVAGYLLFVRRRRQQAGRYAGLSLFAQAGGGPAGWRRRLPALLFLLALPVLLLAIARPSAMLTLPTAHETIVLAIDVSGSMRASDVKPNRLEAAQAAARSFIADQPSATRIGIVSFAATASVVQPPTHKRDDILAAIDRFQVQRGTAIGSAIVVSLATLFPDAGIDLRLLEKRREARAQAGKEQRGRGAGANADPPGAGAAAPAPAAPAAPGSQTAMAIILVTDGQTTAGPDPLEAARLAAERGVRIYTVGIGTLKGEILGGEGWSMRVRLDEDTLKAVAAATQGEYFQAASAAELKRVYAALNTRFVLETRETELTGLLALVAAVLALAGGALSLYWFNRIL